MSYRRARESGPKSGPATVTVCTDYVTRGDLVEHCLPVAGAYAYRDGEVLVSKMVELQDERVGLAAVNAWTLTEELYEIGHALLDENLFAAYGIRDVALAMRRIMLLFIGRSARAAVVVPLAARLPVPSEVRERQDLTASAAGSGWLGNGSAHHEHMFP